MSGDKYFITDQHSPYFLTLTVVQWVDLFCRRDYRDILVESLNYCTKEKYITIFSWVIMSNHLHLVFHSPSEESSKGLWAVNKPLILRGLFEEKKLLIANWSLTLNAGIFVFDSFLIFAVHTNNRTHSMRILLLTKRPGGVTGESPVPQVRLLVCPPPGRFLNQIYAHQQKANCIEKEEACL